MKENHYLSYVFVKFVKYNNIPRLIFKQWKKYSSIQVYLHQCKRKILVIEWIKQKLLQTEDERKCALCTLLVEELYYTFPILFQKEKLRHVLPMASRMER